MKFFLCFVIAIICGCSMQFSTLPKDKTRHRLTNDSAIMRYQATYKMNMGSSEAIIVEIENAATKQRFRAKSRDTVGWPYIVAPPGEYEIHSITIIDPMISKCIKSNGYNDTYMYGFSDSACTEITAKRTRGNVKSGISLLGDLHISKSLPCFATISLRPGETISYAPFLLRGKIKSLTRDLPNLEIIQDTSFTNTHLFCKDTITFSR